MSREHDHFYQHDLKAALHEVERDYVNNDRLYILLIEIAETHGGYNIYVTYTKKERE